MAIKFRKPSWALTLFSLPFLGVGLGFLFVSIIPTLYLGVVAPNWSQVSATLLSASLDVSYGDSTTYNARASYQYRFQGQTYISDRVGINSGNDNIGDWQYRTGRSLENSFANQQPVIAYVNPKSPGTALLKPDIRWSLVGFKMIFVIVFGGLGGWLFIASIIELPNALSRFTRNGKKVRQQAQSDHIYSSARSLFWVLLGLATFVSAISSPVLFSFIDEWKSGNKAIVIALLFPIIGLGLFIAAAREGLRIRKFGRSPLVMSPYPAAIGGYLGAKVHINSSVPPSQRFKVSLSCIQRVTTRSGGKSKTSDVTRWHEEGMAYVERAQGNTTLLRFSFNIPANLHESSDKTGQRYFWRIDIESVISGVKFKRSFEVPVLNVEQPVPTNRYLAKDHPGMVELTFDRIEQLDAEDRGNEFEVSFPRFSYPLERLGGVVFGAIFVGSGIAASMGGAPFIFPLLFVPIGGIIAIVSLVYYLTAAQVLVRNDGVFRRSSFLGLTKKLKSIPAQSISEIHLKPASTWENSSGPKRYYFLIEAIGEQGQKVKLIDRIEGKDTANALIDRFNTILAR
jgi:hypothetical protein